MKNIEQSEDDTNNFENFLTQYFGIEEYHITKLKNPTKRILEAYFKRAMSEFREINKQNEI